MGFDLYGETEAYFRNTIHRWPGLWEYVTHHCGDILSKKDIEEGEWNNGYHIVEEKSLRMAQRLEALLHQGKVAEYEMAKRRFLDSLPLEQCSVCCGTGQVKNRLAWHPFSEENVREFAAFCRASRGFSICY